MKAKGLTLKSDQEQSVDLIRGLVNSTRRWDITPENRKKAVDTVMAAMDDEEVKVRLKAAATLRLMEHDNQDDEWKEKQIEADAQRPPQVLVQNNHHINVHPDAVRAILERRKKNSEVIENIASPAFVSAQASEGAESESKIKQSPL